MKPIDELNKAFNDEIIRETLLQDDKNTTEQEIKYYQDLCTNPWDAVPLKRMKQLLK